MAWNVARAAQCRLPDSSRIVTWLPGRRPVTWMSSGTSYRAARSLTRSWIGAGFAAAVVQPAVSAPASAASASNPGTDRKDMIRADPNSDTHRLLVEQN